MKYNKIKLNKLVRSLFMITFAKILLIGLISTICRIFGQLLIPEGTQNILDPSIYVKNGTLPIAFSIYGLLVYSIISAMFLLLRNNMSGNKVIQGLKYGSSCCLIWVIYLLEPLPHVVPLDKITYPLADSIALLVMGALCGLLLGNKVPSVKNDKGLIEKVRPIVIISAFFVTGRLIQYLIFDIYSSFDDKTLETIIWCIITGIVVACVILWLNLYIHKVNTYLSAVILGLLLFGTNLFLFNFFIPLVFTADMPDLITRTVIDIISVTIGCLFMRNGKRQRHD
jgi:hypothetical protein